MDEKKPDFLQDENTDNKFLIALRKVINMLKIDERNPFSMTITKNMRTLAAEIEMNLDYFLEDLKIPFRTEDFLLILFQEMYEEFTCSGQDLVEQAK